MVSGLLIGKWRVREAAPSRDGAAARAGPRMRERVRACRRWRVAVRSLMLLLMRVALVVLRERLKREIGRRFLVFRVEGFRMEREW